MPENKNFVFMFTGQGSQYYHMGKELYRQHPVFRDWMDKFENQFYELTGGSLLQSLYDDNKKISDLFQRITETHPAIFMVEYALARVMIEYGIKPSIVLGSSMGEFAAAAISGVMPPGQALEMLIKQAGIFETYCSDGGMLTILYDHSLYNDMTLMRKNTELVAVNYANHFVISGKKEILEEIKDILKKEGISYQLLPVTFAFHSHWIEPAEKAYCSYLSGKCFQKPGIPFVSCMQGGTVQNFPSDYFWHLVRRPMVFPQALEYLEAKDNYTYLDLGPSGTLANFVKNNLKPGSQSNYFSFMTPFGGELEKITKFKESFLSTQESSIYTSKEERKMIAYLFPGQGAQKKGMGEGLFEMFAGLTKKADEILGYSIKELCMEDPGGRLVQTQYTQPAMYIVNALTYLKKTLQGPKPDYVMGHSVAEYDALFAAGVVDFETGLKLVKKRGELMAQASGGGMAAVMRLRDDRVEEILKENNFTTLSVANYNSPFQIVISGPRVDIERAEKCFLENGANPYRILNVSGAFHTPYMAPAKKEFAEFVNNIQFNKIQIPIISNVTARPYKQDKIKENIIEQITTPVRWTESIRYLLAKGAEEFEEIGPETGLSVVKALAIRIKHEAGPLDISIIEKEEALEAAAAQAEPAAQEAQAAQAEPVVQEQLIVEVIDKENEKEIQEETAVETGKKIAAEKEKQSKPAKSIKEKIAEKLMPGKKKEKEQEIVKEAKTIKEPEIEKEAVKIEVKEAAPLAQITPGSLGCQEFKKDFNLKYAYAAGGMYKGIASRELVVKMGKAGFLAFYGSGGMELKKVEEAIIYIQKELNNGQAYGMNLIANPLNPQAEDEIVDLFIKYGVKTVEAAAYMQISPALVRYRAKGLNRDANQNIEIPNKIIAKISRPEIAEQFLSPAPERVVTKLLAANKITSQEAGLLKEIPMADYLCVEADSGGHTDQGMPYALMPAMIKLRDEMTGKWKYAKKIGVGAAGGIGTPDAAAAAFILGADFIVTGSINQCSVEAATSDEVKDILQDINVQDTDYVPSADMFELGAKCQVLKKGVFFPARANKLLELYRRYNSLDEIDAKTKEQLQERYFKRSFSEIYEDCKSFYSAPEIERAEQNPKQKMSLVFKWYFGYATRLALEGNKENKVDYQVPCGPALGAFNQWVKGTELENWRNRHVDVMADKIMLETAGLLSRRFHSFTREN